MATLPGLNCKGCSAPCCRTGGPDLTADDDPELYRVTAEEDIAYITPREDGLPFCRYLNPANRCRIHKIRPKRCREFDCRLYFLNKTPEDIARRVAASPASTATLDAGLKRLGTLPENVLWDRS